MHDFVLWCKNQQFRFLSVDVFDTLLLRQSASPAGVFALAGAMLEQERQLPPGITVADYSAMRIQAELSCRRQFAAKEITLKQILACMPGNQRLHQAYAEAELQAEQQLCVLNHELIQALQQLHQSGVQIVLLSDMYLNTEQIRQYLFSDQRFLLGLPLSVSCETGAAKHDGSGFSWLQNHAKFEKQGWLHIGDNWQADIVQARNFGIRAAWYAPRLDMAQLYLSEQLPATSADFNAERRLRSIPPQWWLNPDEQQHPDMQTAYSLGASVWGPVLTAFADWILHQAARRQCKAILCFMREGQLFAEVLRSRLPMHSQALRIDAVYVSRRALYWPSLQVTEPDWLTQLLLLLRDQKGYSVKALCDDLDLALPAELADYQQQLLADTSQINMDNQSLWHLLVELAQQSEHQLRLKISQQKQAFEHYWQSLSLPDSAQIALVDLGHGGTCHRLLSNILQADFALNLLFYHSDRSLAHNSRIGFSSFLRQHPAVCQLLARAEKAFEPWLVGAAGTTLSYQPDGLPVFGPAELNSVQTTAFRDGVLAFANHYRHTDLDADVAASILRRFISKPQLQEADLYQRLFQEDNFGAQCRYPVLDDTQIAVVRQIGASQAWLNWQMDPLWQSQQLHWPQALLRLADPEMAAQLFGEFTNLTAQRSRRLLEQLQRAGWTSYAICGVGEFFRQFQQQPGYSAQAIECLIDQKADTLGSYLFEQWQVLPLQQALQNGTRRFVVTSYAFRQQMAAQIHATAQALGITSPLSIMMLGQE